MLNIKKHLSIYRGLPKDIYLIFISTVINKMGGFITPLMTLIMTVKIGFSQSEVGLFSTIAMLSQAPFIMIGGILVDKFGGKKVIVVLHTIGALVYLFCGFMKPNLMIAIMIIVASDIYAMASPAFNAIVPIVTPEPLIKNAYSLMYLGLNLGLAVGSLIGGILFNNYLSLLFIIDALTTLFTAGLILVFFKGTKVIDKPIPMNEIKKEKTEDKDSIISFLYNTPILIIFSVILLVYNFCYIQWNFMLPLQSVSIFNENGPKAFSLLISINAITVVVLSPLLTSLTQKLYSLKSIFLGGIFYFISFMLFAFNKFMIIFILSIIIMTIGEILITINANNYIAKSTPKKYMGRANSLLFIMNGVGYAIGPVVMGNILAYTTFKNSWLLVSVLMLGALLSMYFISRFEKINDNNSEDFDLSTAE